MKVGDLKIGDKVELSRDFAVGGKTFKKATQGMVTMVSTDDLLPFVRVLFVGESSDQPVSMSALKKL